MTPRGGVSAPLISLHNCCVYIVFAVVKTQQSCRRDNTHTRSHLARSLMRVSTIELHVIWLSGSLPLTIDGGI
jgi:hypothetical protein